VRLVHPDVATMLDVHGLPAGRRADFADSRSGALFERVGDRHVLKRMQPGRDWIMTVLGDPGWSVRAWESGLIAALPATIDTAYVSCARDGDGWAVLLDDVGEHLVPEGHEPISADDNAAFLRAMRATHSAWRGLRGTALLDLPTRLREFDPASMGPVLGVHPVPQLVVDGWAALPDAAGLPDAARPVLRALSADRGPLVRALQTLPQTVTHGDWKLGNLGRRPDGRVLLLDWQVVGPAPAATDLGWYLAVNSRRLPVSREECIELSGPWSPDELALGLLYGIVQLGWNKVTEPDELAWWGEWVVRAAALL
jgi:hypothetical protein